MDYKDRISYLVEFECNVLPETLLDVTEGINRILMVECNGRQILIFAPVDSSNINEYSFFGVDRGKAQRAELEGFTEDEIIEKIECYIPLEDEQNAANFISGKSYLKKGQVCEEKVTEILAKELTSPKKRAE